MSTTDGPVRTQETPTSHAGSDSRLQESPATTSRSPEEISAEVQRMAIDLAQEESEARTARANAKKAKKSGRRYVNDDGTEVKPYAAFQDAVNLDGSEMVDAVGNSLVKAGYTERWVRFDEGPNDTKDMRRINQFKAEGYEPVRDPETDQPLTSRLGMAMQAPVRMAAKRTLNKTPYGVTDRALEIDKMQEKAREINRSVGYAAILPYDGARLDQHFEEHKIPGGS